MQIFHVVSLFESPSSSLSFEDVMNSGDRKRTADSSLPSNASEGHHNWPPAISSTLSSPSPASSSHQNMLMMQQQNQLLTSNSSNITVPVHHSSSAFANEDLIRPLPLDFKPSANSVLTGRGKVCTEASGSQRLKQIAEKFLEPYSKADTKNEKTEVVSKIIEIVEKSCPDGRGAFIKMDKGRWWEVGKSAARERVGYVLRNLLHDKYRSSSKSKAMIRRSKLEAEGKIVSKKCSSRVATAAAGGTGDDHDHDGAHFDRAASLSSSGSISISSTTNKTPPSRRKKPPSSSSSLLADDYKDADIHGANAAVAGGRLKKGNDYGDFDDIVRFGGGTKGKLSSSGSDRHVIRSNPGYRMLLESMKGKIDSNIMSATTTTTGGGRRGGVTGDVDVPFSTIPSSDVLLSEQQQQQHVQSYHGDTSFTPASTGQFLPPISLSSNTGASPQRQQQGWSSTTGTMGDGGMLDTLPPMTMTTMVENSTTSSLGGSGGGHNNLSSSSFSSCKPQQHEAGDIHVNATSSSGLNRIGEAIDCLIDNSPVLGGIMEGDSTPIDEDEISGLFD